MDLNICIRNTSELNAEDIGKINTLKNQHWKHTKEEHMQWFKDNIKQEDMHLLIWGGTAFLHI